MPEIYPEQTKAEIERVLDVFRDYINSTSAFDIIWSDKAGYIYYDLYTRNAEFIAGEDRCAWIKDAPRLVKVLICEMVTAFLDEIQSEKCIKELSEQECKKIVQRLHPYMEKLPEYEYLVPIVFMHGWRCTW